MLLRKVVLTRQKDDSNLIWFEYRRLAICGNGLSGLFIFPEDITKIEIRIYDNPRVERVKIMKNSTLER